MAVVSRHKQTDLYVCVFSDFNVLCDNYHPGSLAVRACTHTVRGWKTADYIKPQHEDWFLHTNNKRVMCNCACVVVTSECMKTQCVQRLMRTKHWWQFSVSYCLSRCIDLTCGIVNFSVDYFFDKYKNCDASRLC